MLFKNELIEEKNKDIMDSIYYAQKIQKAILPQEELREKILPNSFILFKPKDVVSGDFYWIAERDNKVFFTAADCTGHGVPGAFMSMVGTSLFNATVNEKGIIEPAKILDHVRAGVIKSLKQGEGQQSRDGMDAGLCALDTEKNILEYAGANNPLYIVRHKDGPGLCDKDGQPLEIIPNLEDDSTLLYEVKPNKQPVAYYTEKAGLFTNHTVQLYPNDALYLSSDGFADQFGGPKGKKFKYKVFKQLLMSIMDYPVERQHSILNQEIEDWMAGEYEQVDDICVLGVKIV